MMDIIKVNSEEIMKYESMELSITQYREAKIAARNARLAERLARPKSAEDMLRALRAVGGLNVKEREAATSAVR